MEAIEILQGKVKGDLLTVAMALASRMLVLAGLADSIQSAGDKLYGVLDSGRALEKLGEIITAQGGNGGVIHDLSLLPRAPLTQNLYADTSGVISNVDCRGLGTAAGELGAGRLKKDDSIDLSVGFILKKRIGDSVKASDVLCEVHASDAEKLKAALKKIRECITISDSSIKPTLIYEEIV